MYTSAYVPIYVYLIVGIGRNHMASGKFRTLKINLAIGFTQKTGWNALVRLK